MSRQAASHDALSADPWGPNIFLMGVSKAATTWIYRCLQEHPGVFVPESDSLRFFDLRYHEGLESYQAHFAAARPEQVSVDPSPTYFRSPVAPQRIARHYPSARIVLSLRNPIDRAFSQFWQEKKQGRFDYTFDQVLEHPLLFPWIIEHGFYATHLQNLLRHFARDQVTIVLYDDLVANPRAFLEQVLHGMGMNPEFVPSVIGKRVNEGGVKQTESMRRMRMLGSIKGVAPVRNWLKRRLNVDSLYQAVGGVLSNRDEYEAGMPDEVRTRLEAVYREELAALEQVTGLDLGTWRSGAKK